MISKRMETVVVPVMQTALRGAWHARRAVHLSERLLSGLALGLLSDDALGGLTQSHYARADRYASSDVVRSGFREWEAEAIDEHFPSGGKVLVLAAGGGREVWALRERNFEVYAAECEPRLVERMREAFAQDPGVSRIDLVKPNEMPSNLPKLDAVVFGWGGYTHVPGRDTRVLLLRQIAETINEDGPLMLSFWTGRTKTSGRLERIEKWLTHAIHSRARSSSRPPEDGDCVAAPGFYAHLFTKAEIQSELADAGLGLIHYSATPYGHAIARRI